MMRALAVLAAVVAAVACGAVAASVLDAPADAADPGARAYTTSVLNALGAPDAARWIVLQDPPPALAPERDAFAAHVAGGGRVFVATEDQRALASWIDAPPRLLAGHIYDANGSLAGPGGAVAAGPLRALDLAETSFTPVALSAPDSFRDTNGNRRLDAGEPRGPFVVVARAEAGDGARYVVGAAGAAAVSDVLARVREPGDGDVATYARGDGAAAQGAHSALRVATLPRAGLLAAAVAVLATACGAVVVLEAPRSRPPDDDALAAALDHYHAARARDASSIPPRDAP